MSLSIFVIIGLIVFAGLLASMWSRADAKRTQRAKQLEADLASLGDEAIPTTLIPLIDPRICIGSGACVKACPQHDPIGLIDGKARLVNALGCIGHGACARACPVGAIRLVFGTATRGVELPQVDPHFQTNQAGIYIIGELGGMGLIRNAVSQGRQAADHVVASGRRGRRGDVDAIVVGAGPAGISATLRLLEGGLRVALLEREQFGGTIHHYPRAKVVMTGPLDIPGYGRVRRRTMSKEQMLELWDVIRKKTRLPVATGELVSGIVRDDGAWRVRSTSGERRTPSVLLALGRRGAPRRLGVPGEDLEKVSYRLLEPEPFAGKHVLVVGGGNSAVENAIALGDSGVCRSVAISYRRDQFARVRASNRERIQALVAAGRVQTLMPTEVAEIGPNAVQIKKAGAKNFEVPNDAVIVQIGGTAPTDLLSSFGVQMVTKHGVA